MMLDANVMRMLSGDDRMKDKSLLELRRSPGCVVVLLEALDRA